MQTAYFNSISPFLPEAEREARAKRQRHAEWGITVARLGGTEPGPEILHDLQRYIDGELSLEELAGLVQPSDPQTRAYQAAANRDRMVS